jgi:hypothetical protein
MPRIQTYNAQIAPAMPGGGLSTPASFGAGLGAGAGEMLAQAGLALYAKQDRDALASIHADMAKVRGDWLQRLADKQESAEPGAPDFTKSVLEEYDAAMDKMRADRPHMTKALGDRLGLEQQQFRNSLQQAAIGFEAQSRATKRRQDASDYQRNISRNAYNDPNMFGIELERVDEAMAAFGLKGDALARQTADAKIDLAENTVKGLIARGHLDAARVGLTEGPTAQFLSGDKAAVLHKAIESEQHRLDGEAERAAARRRADAANEVRVLSDDVFAAIEAHGKSPDEPRLKRAIAVAYSETPELGQRITGQIDNAKAFYVARQHVALSTPEQDRARLEELNTRTTGMNAAQFARETNAMQQALRRKYTELANDPLAYVAKNDPTTAELLRSDDPDAFRRGLVRANLLQEQLGVPVYQRAYLGQTQAANLAQEINTAEPEQAANRIEQLRTRYGGYFPHVVAELEQGKLSPTFVTIARMDRPEDAVPRVNLAIANQIGVTELEKTLGERAKAISDRVLKSIEEYSPALSTQGTYANRLLTADMQSVKALAYLYARQGATDGDASKRAFDEVLGNRYDFRRTWLAPRGLAPNAESMAGEVLSQLTAADMTPEKGGNPALSDEYRRNAALQEAKRQGLWVNMPGGDGIMLVTPRGPVLRANGQPIQVLFKDAANWKPNAPVVKAMEGLVIP